MDAFFTSMEKVIGSNTIVVVNIRMDFSQDLFCDFIANFRNIISN